MQFICVNGDFVPADQPVLPADNRSYRYGDGLFETMKLVNNKIPLASYHFERLFKGMELLRFNIPSNLTIEKLTRAVMDLHDINNKSNTARIRLSVSRNNTAAHDWKGPAQYIIEYFPRDSSANELNSQGFVLDLYHEAHKSCDVFSNLKSANYLPCAMATIHAKENNLDDCFVLNQYDRIAEASIANVFLIKNYDIITPPLSEGCVDGVMRKYLLEHFREPGHPFRLREEPITIDTILEADELFLSNAMYGMRWVKQIKAKTYTNQLTAEIYRQLVQIIWQ